MMTCRRRRSLYQELLGVAPSGRRILISSKSELAGVVDGRRQNPIERELSRLLGLHHRILVPELRIVIMEVCQRVRIDFATAHSHNLNRATKKDMLDWIAEQWEEYQEAFIAITAKQKAALDLSYRPRVDDDST
jgi:hypothetical protein